MCIFFFGMLPPISLAQTVQTSCAVTKVGSPQDSPSLPTACTTASQDTGSTITSADSIDIVSWAEKITAALRPNLWSYYNNMTANICSGTGYCATKATGNSEVNLYWCTYLVVDAYNLSDKKGLNITSDAAVVNMMQNWKNMAGYTFYPYDPGNPSNPENRDTLSKIHPGVAFFFAEDPHQTVGAEHTGLVKSISIDKNGNGSITSLESNSDKTSHTYIISDWTFKGAFFPLRGFGGV